MKKENALNKILSVGSEMVSNLGGVAVGAVLGGPAGAMIGASASPILNMLFQTASEDLISKKISKRETQKIGAGYQFALKRIETNLNAGRTLREDGFIDNENILSDSNTILEGVTTKLQKEWELKKLVLYGNFLGNISFEKNIDFNYATVLLRLVEDLSYRQLCLIAVISRCGTPEINLKPIYSRFRDTSMQHNFNFSLYSDLVDLVNKSILKAIGSISLGATLSNSILSDVGEKLYRLMNLNEIERADFIKVKGDLEDALGENLRAR